MTTRTKTKAAEWTSDSLLALIRSKYPLPQFAVLAEVPDATSYNKSRVCDAIAVGCWKSVGMHVHGFEIKVSRSDWLRELQDRKKAATFEQYVHFWWIVAAPGIVKLEELPASWGLMEPRGSGLTTKSAADLRTPTPITTEMLAAFMRRACQSSASVDELKAARDEGYRSGFESGKRRTEASNHEAVANSERKAREILQTSIREFEEASGVRIGAYDGGAVGKQFAAFREIHQYSHHQNMLKSMLSASEQLSASARELIGHLESVRLAKESAQ